MKKKTFLFGYAPLSRITNEIERAIEDDDWELYKSVGKGVVLHNRRDVLIWALQQRNNHLLEEICMIAAQEGKIDVLDETWNNVNNEEDKREVFVEVGSIAARGGKLNVLKWIEDKGSYFDKNVCAAQAAGVGQFHIIQWLREEKGLRFKGELYECAIEYSGQLEVLNWLREQGCPWGRFTFYFAAGKGNLAILQWLHDEGCPWPDENDFAISAEKSLLSPLARPLLLL